MTADCDAFAAALLDWFAIHGRHDLPWQTPRDPYRVWVSEIMLQQTQVATVIPYFERFVERFPAVGALAAAPLDDVLACWSGLGYYARARNLHRAAGLVVAEHGGALPRSLAALVALPGIGRSTAAAILAQCWNEPHAILDGNVKRVLARFHAVHGFTGKADVLASLWSLAESHTPRARAADYTQAIMDLGATICVRRSPRCEACPVAGGCRALAEGLVDMLPEPRPKRVRPRRRCTVVVLRSAADGLLLERRPPSGIWGGLLSLPELPDDAAPAAWCRDALGIEAVETDRLAPIDHGFTHFDLSLEPVVLDVAGNGRARSAATGRPAAGPGAEAPSDGGGRTVYRPADEGERTGVRGSAATIERVLDSDRWLWYNTADPLPGGVAAPIGRLIERLRVAPGD